MWFGKVGHVGCGRQAGGETVNNAGFDGRQEPAMGWRAPCGVLGAVEYFSNCQKEEVAMSPSASQAVAVLRDPSQFQWYVIPLLLVVIYIYSVEIGRRNWHIVFAGLAFWGMDWFNEIWNALVFHFTGYAPVWSAPAKTAYLILVGLNIEICFMFAIMGVAAAHNLPRDKHFKILRVPNRVFIAVAFSIACVAVEVILNLAGALVWDYGWWSARVPYLIFLIGYLPFFLVSFWVHDMASVKAQAAAVGGILGVDAACLIVFGGVLGWL